MMSLSDKQKVSYLRELSDVIINEINVITVINLIENNSYQVILSGKIMHMCQATNNYSSYMAMSPDNIHKFT